MGQFVLEVNCVRGNNGRCWRARLEAGWEGLSPSGLTLPGVPPEDFMVREKYECHFENGMEHVRYVHRDFYNREEITLFDSDVGKYVALTELGRPDAEYWNSQKEILERRRASVDTLCRHNYVGIEASFFPPVQPQVTLYPSKMAPPGHHNLLFCSISGFYPGDIEVWWFLNGREETAGVQTLVMLEMTPQHGDVYTCHVKHSSLQRPIILDWKAQSESAQSKMLSRVGGLVLGLIFLGVGLIVHKRSQKGERLWGQP
uniref:Ig-like domain-containing protein n=1 Tax=Sarcophilus harrisii TaxID=9305 RepID=A0A7N4V1X5_SARHA